LSDPNDVAFIDNKGWKSPADLYKSYRGAETLIGKDVSSLITLPKAGDTAGWDAVYTKLGRPVDAKGYDLKAGMAEGAQVDEAMMATMSGLFFKAGLNPDQAKAIAGEYNVMAAQRAKDAHADYERNVTTDKASLIKDWGGGYERMMNSAQTAVASLGFDGKMVDALETAIGYAGTMKFFAGLGQKLGEHKFVGGDSNVKFSGTMTPQEASAEITKLKSDGVFQGTMRDKLNPANKENVRKWQELFAIAYPG